MWIVFQPAARARMPTLFINDILNFMKTAVILLCLGCSFGVGATTEVVELSAYDWARPRSGEMVVGLEPVAAVVHQLMQRPASQLIIRFPGGDEGSLWAQELRAWLISLGIGSDRIRVSPGSPREDVMELAVRPDQGAEATP